MVYTDTYKSPLGNIILAYNNTALIGLWFEGQKYFPVNLIRNEQKIKSRILIDTYNWLDMYFDGKIPDFTPELCFDSTIFRHSIWSILLSIPYGKTITYGDIAKRIADEREVKNFSAQAVGGAVGHNPISIIIPCHRVVGVNGNLTGYAGGLDKKTKLLELEKILLS